MEYNREAANSKLEDYFHNIDQLLVGEGQEKVANEIAAAHAEFQKLVDQYANLEEDPLHPAPASESLKCASLCITSMLQRYGKQVDPESNLSQAFLDAQRQLALFIQICNNEKGVNANTPPGIILNKTAFGKNYVDHVDTFEKIVNQANKSNAEALAQIAPYSKDQLKEFKDTLLATPQTSSRSNVSNNPARPPALIDVKSPDMQATTPLDPQRQGSQPPKR